MHGVVYAEWGKLVLLLIVVMLNVIMLSGMAPLSGVALLGRL
jgi:cell division protein FtsW (lipid II flippase)